MVLRTPKQLAASKHEFNSSPVMIEVNLGPVKSSAVDKASIPTQSQRHGHNRLGVQAVLRLSLLTSLAFLATLALLIVLLATVWRVHLYVITVDAQPAAVELERMEFSGGEGNTCSIDLVESIPLGLKYNASFVHHESTYNAWKRLLDVATGSVDIASYYWSLLGADVVPDPSDAQGEDIYRSLMETGLLSKITLRIVENEENGHLSNNETANLESVGAAQVRRLNFTALVGAGILHTKMWLVDDRHFYVGSANLDYRSLTQVKELGALIANCSSLAADMRKIFQVYWLVGSTGVIPDQWPPELHTEINRQKPLPVQLPNETALVYLASSPPVLCPPGRTSDGDAIVYTINAAKRFVYIAVMDYYPMLIYGRFTYWPVIDDALRSATVSRRVEVRLLASYWNHTREDMLHGLRSLQALNATRSHVLINVRMFEVPPYSGRQIPFSRVNHNKYMVTDQVAYIGTSNWSGDYFVNTGGIGLVVNSTSPGAPGSVRSQLEAVFLRDWNSEHARPLSHYQ